MTKIYLIEHVSDNETRIVAYNSDVLNANKIVQELNETLKRLGGHDVNSSSVEYTTRERIQDEMRAYDPGFWMSSYSYYRVHEVEEMAQLPERLTLASPKLRPIVAQKLLTDLDKNGRPTLVIQTIKDVRTMIKPTPGLKDTKDMVDGVWDQLASLGLATKRITQF